MKTVAQLIEERDALLSQAEEILDLADEGDRMPTPEEQARYDTALKHVADLNAKIEQRSRLEKIQASTVGVTRAAGVQQITDEPDTTPHATMVRTASGPRIEIPRHYGSLRAFDNTPDGAMTAYRAGMWLAAHIYQHAGAFDWCQRNGVPVRAALSGGINTAGGALVPEEMDRSIIKLVETYGVFRQNARVAVMGSDAMTRPRRTGGLSAYYIGENAEGTESDEAWDNVNLSAKKMMVLTRMSSELNEDAIINMADETADEIARAFALKEDQSGFTGDGSSTYGGITGVLVKAIATGYGKAKVAAASGHDTLAEIDADDLLNLMARIPQYARMGSKWYMSPSASALILDAIKMAGGGNTSGNWETGTGPTMMGYPVVVTDVMNDDPTATYNGSVVCAFGNLAMAATIGLRRGIRIGLSDQRYWSADQIAIKGTMRHDIVAHDLGSDSVKSPFAVLVGTT